MISYMIIKILHDNKDIIRIQMDNGHNDSE